MKSVKFNAVQNLSYDNSYGTIKEENGVELSVEIGFKDNENGWFELYDVESGGEEWYAEGGLWFEGKSLTDYDGVFSLPKCIEDKLEELGYDLSQI